MSETVRTIHQGQPVLTFGRALGSAEAAVILLHGRGSSAGSILQLAEHLPRERITYLAPQAAGNAWYPNSGFLPLENNQPFIASAFQAVADLVTRVTQAGIASERIVLGGFSQGACLAAEYVARHPQRFGGLFVLSGALLGPPDMPRQYDGSLAGTPVFVGGAERDAWVTEHQLRLTGRILQELGGTVQVEVQPGGDHTVRASEIDQVRALISNALA